MSDTRRITALSGGTEYCDNLVVNSKYTVITFIPKNIIEQFSKVLNCYFLLIAMLQFIPVIAPVNPMSTILPLIFAFTLTAVKEAADDLNRHREDNKFNEREYEVANSSLNGLEKIKSKDIQVGDVVKLKKGDEIPCDLLLLQSSDEGGVAYIRTDNLDGEIDLKSRTSLEVTQTLDDCTSFTGTVTCEQPDMKIYHFNSVIDFKGDHHPVSSEQLLLQSCFLQNTDWVLGLAVYTGNDTKCCQAKQVPPLKTAHVDRQISSYAVVVFICQICVALVMGIIGNVILGTSAQDAWYLSMPSVTAQDYIIIPMRFFLLTSVMIPISFKVIIDVSKYLISILISNDLAMYDPDEDCPAKANNTSIAEDLGQIDIILTDKTGTLTDNKMVFKACSLGGNMIGDSTSGALDQNVFMTRTDVAYVDFATMLSLCHTVTICDVSHELSSPSPDEEALVKAAMRMGSVLTSRSKSEIKITSAFSNSSPSDQVAVSHEILHVMEFNSDRKMMSILLRNKTTGTITLYSKGADDKMIPRLDSTLYVDSDRENLLSHLESFAITGLRTLVLGKKDVSEEDFQKFTADVKEALKITGDERDVQIASIYQRIENNLSFVGATAIEDKLQDGVPETIELLRNAGLNFWMLTGDKFETAQQISRSCGLWSQNEILLSLSLKNGEAKLMADLQSHTKLANSFNGSDRLSEYGTFQVSPKAGEKVKTSEDGDIVSTLSTDVEDAELRTQQSGTVRCISRKKKNIIMSPLVANTKTKQTVEMIGRTDCGGYVLIVDGATIEFLLGSQNEEYGSIFKELTVLMNSVICCRVTPNQKAQLTSIAKNANNGQRVLSIGDGGNDVSMIQEATIGVGIVGKEGKQASRAADYSIGRFRFLQRLLLVHGHYSYQRSCFIAQYCFYKSMEIAIIQVFFNFFTLFSGISYWDSLLLTCWNGVFTLPAPFLYLFNKILPAEKLLASPEIYSHCQKGKAMTHKTFGGCLVLGILHGVLALLITLAVFNGDFSGVNGDPMDFRSIYTITYASLMCIQVWIVLLESHTLTVYNIVGILMMPLLYVAFTFSYAAIPRMQYFGVAKHLASEPTVYLTILLLTFGFLVPNLASEGWRMNYNPTAIDAARVRGSLMSYSGTIQDVTQNDDFTAIDVTSSSPQLVRSY